jgi:hypothetical protein
MRILFAAQDPGGCDAIVPVIKNLSKSKKNNICCLVSGKAKDVLAKLNVPFIYAESFDNKKVESELKRFNPDAIVTGTSFGLSTDKLALEAGKKDGIPTISIIDYWANYWARFKDPSGTVLMPDKICVIDAIMKDEMIKEGFYPKSIVITGNPRFDSFGQKEKVKNVLAKFGKDKGNKLKKQTNENILFISQPFSELENQDQKIGIGYTEFDALSGIIDVLKDINKENNIRFRVVIRPHPKENPGKFSEIVRKNKELRIKVDAKSDLSKAMYEARLIIGMSSMVLFQAAMERKEVVSYQPDVKKDLNILDKLNISKTIKTKKHLYQRIREVLLSKNVSAVNKRIIHTYTKNNSTKKMIDIIRIEVGRKKSK